VTSLVLALVLGALCVAFVVVVAVRARMHDLEREVRWWAELHDAPSHVRKLDRER